MPNANRWTAARFHSFIKSALRAASNRWPPKYECKKAAWLRRGVYLCAGYNAKPHEAPAKDVFVDHVQPVVDPIEGFTTWDNFVERLFCEQSNLQLLCRDCHGRKTKEERAIRTSVIRQS